MKKRANLIDVIAYREKDRKRKCEARLISCCIKSEAEAIHEYEEMLVDDWSLSDETRELIEYALEEEKAHLLMFQNRLNEVDGIDPNVDVKKAVSEKNEKNKKESE